VAEVALETRSVAVITLNLALTVGDRLVTPPRGLATGITGRESDLRELRSRLDAAAHKAFGSTDVAIDELRFTDAGTGHVTAILDIVTRGSERMLADRFAGGLTSLTDGSRRPLESYFRDVIGDPELDVVVTDSYVEQREPDPPAPTAPSLTLKQQTLARLISGVMFVLVTLFVLGVLLDVFPFSIVVLRIGR
jgi:hypothetical protein